MKKIAAVLALLCAPVLVYFGVFLYFEPYDYFGLKGGAVQEDSYITRVRKTPFCWAIRAWRTSTWNRWRS